MLISIAAVLSTMHLAGEVPTTGGDYLDVPFDVPANTQEITITHDDGSSFVILDFGVWQPDGTYRGWGGGNTEPIVIGVDESSRSYRIGPIAAGTWHLVIGKAQLGATGNMFVADVTCTDTPTLTVRPAPSYSPASLTSERRWYAGDFHVHSTESGDASASFDEIHTVAKMNGLDFVNLSDHNTDAHHALVAAVQPSVTDLLYLRGAEITTYKGHGNSVGVPAYVDHRIGYDNRTITGVLDEVAAAGGIFIVNHPALDLGDICIGCAWEHADTPWDKVHAMELITGNFEVGINAFVPRVIALWETQLDAGHHIAVVGGSDDHDAGKSTGPTASPIGSPTTLVLADNLSEAAIIAAIKAGRTMVKLRAASDPDLEVTLDGHEIGDTITKVGTAKFDVHVSRGNGSSITLVRNGEEVKSVSITSDDFTTAISDEPGAGAFRYRIEIANDVSQRVVVTSHFYVDAIAVEDGCGCRSTRPAGVFPLVGVVVIIVRRRRAAASR